MNSDFIQKNILSEWLKNMTRTKFSVNIKDILCIPSFCRNTFLVVTACETPYSDVPTKENSFSSQKIPMPDKMRR